MNHDTVLLDIESASPARASGAATVGWALWPTSRVAATSRSSWCHVYRTTIYMTLALLGRRGLPNAMAGDRRASATATMVRSQAAVRAARVGPESRRRRRRRR